jgi:hypothetical protein
MTIPTAIPNRIILTAPSRNSDGFHSIQTGELAMAFLFAEQVSGRIKGIGLWKIWWITAASM